MLRQLPNATGLVVTSGHAPLEALRPCGVAIANAVFADPTAPPRPPCLRVVDEAG